MINNSNKNNRNDKMKNARITKQPNCQPNQLKSLTPAISFKSLKNKYRRACYLLKKIEENKKDGTADTIDIANEIESKKIIEEYERYLNAKRGVGVETTFSSSDINLTSTTLRKHTQDNKASRAAVSKSPTIENADQKSDGISLALVDEDFRKNNQVTDMWLDIERKLSEMIIEYILGTTADDPIPYYDSSKIFRGCRIIKCMDQFSKDLIVEYVAQISDSWKGFKLKLVPAENIPRRPCARIWLPKMTTTTLSNDKLLKYLKLHNPGIPMNDWHIIRDATPNQSSMSYLLVVNEESMEVLKQFDNKLNFGVRKAKIKIFPRPNMKEKANDIDNASSLLEDINIADEF